MHDETIDQLAHRAVRAVIDREDAFKLYQKAGKLNIRERQQAWQDANDIEDRVLQEYRDRVLGTEAQLTREVPRAG